MYPYSCLLGVVGMVGMVVLTTMMMVGHRDLDGWKASLLPGEAGAPVRAYAYAVNVLRRR